MDRKSLCPDWIEAVSEEAEMKKRRDNHQAKVMKEFRKLAREATQRHKKKLKDHP